MSGKKGRKCSMINCSSFQHTHKHLSFFRFPKDPVRCNLWIEKSGRPELADKTAVYEDRICELHFDETMFLNDYRNRLHQAAVPNPLLIPSPALAAPSETTPGSEPPLKRPKHNMGTGGMTEMLGALTKDTHKHVAPAQHTTTTPGPANAFANTSTQQQAYVIAAHAVQTNAMTLLEAAERFGVDFVTLRRFCRRIEKTIGKPQNTLNPFVPFDASPKQNMDQVTLEKAHKKQYQMALLEKEIMIQERMLMQQQIILGTEMKASAASTAARKEDKKSSPALKLDTSGGQHTRRPRQIFSLQQEEELANFVRETSDYYSGMSSKDVRTLAFVYAVCNRVEMPTGWRESSQASFDWCLGFIKRNKLSPMMTTSNMYKATQDKSLSSKSFNDTNPEAETTEC